MHSNTYIQEEHPENPKNNSIVHRKQKRNENNWDKTKEKLTILFLCNGVSVRMKYKGKIDQYRRSPEEGALIFVKKMDLPRISRKYLIVVANVSIVYIRIGKDMMSYIMLIFPPGVGKSYTDIGNEMREKSIYVFVLEILPMDEIMRNIRKLDDNNIEVKNAHEERKSSHENNSKNVEKYSDTYTDKSIYRSRLVEFMNGNPRTEFIEVANIIFFALHDILL